MTNPLYLQNTYLFEETAKILQVGQDEKGDYLILDQTIFYPQGGGQPSDQGKITGADFAYTVSQVRQIEGEIRHYLQEIPSPSSLNTPTSLSIDSERRLLNARYHTAAHLLGNVVEDLFPELKAVKGHSFPKEAYVEFQGATFPDMAKIQEKFEGIIHEDMKTQFFEMDRPSFEAKFYVLPYPTPEHKAFRVMQIGDLLPIPCGGTHLASTAEIKGIQFPKVKSKDGAHRIFYELV
jgi:alanyl-tRNA synthetase